MATNNKYTVFDKMMEGVQVINYDWQYIYVNETVVQQGKNTKEGLIGFTMMEKYPGIESSEFFKVLEKCMHERKFFQIINEFDFPDGSKGWFDLKLEPVEDGVLIMSFDITTQKRMELELRRLNEELESRVVERTKELLESLNREKELNNMKSRFVSMASHEFRTPLSTILSSISLVERYADAEQVEKRVKHIERIKSSIRNLTAILNDFLSLEKLEQGKTEVEKQPFNIKFFILEVIEETECMSKNGQCIRYIHNGADEVLLDRKILRNVMFNLLSNAIKYSSLDINIQSQVNEDAITLSVTDQGIGIPKEEQEHLFNRFFRAKNATNIQGTGLGLNIVKRYIELMGGTINFSSEQHKGTTFVVCLPNATHENFT